MILSNDSLLHNTVMDYNSAGKKKVATVIVLDSIQYGGLYLVYTYHYYSD